MSFCPDCLKFWSFVFNNLKIICLAIVFVCIYSIWWFLSFLDLRVGAHHWFRKISTISLFNYFFCSVLFLFWFSNYMHVELVHIVPLKCSTFLKCHSFLFVYYNVFHFWHLTMIHYYTFLLSSEIIIQSYILSTFSTRVLSIFMIVINFLSDSSNICVIKVCFCRLLCLLTVFFFLCTSYFLFVLNLASL